VGEEGNKGISRNNRSRKRKGGIGRKEKKERRSSSS
jgi:hypothetical protein